MVKLTIDGTELQVKDGTTILDAALQAGIHIPTLCYLKKLNKIGACRVCMVEVEGNSKLVTACNTRASEGMIVHTNSPKVRKTRKINVELILSQHDSNCAICARSGNCSLQKLSNDLGILEMPFEKQLPKTKWNPDYPLIRDYKKCIKCMRCVQVCDKVQSLHIWDVAGNRLPYDGGCLPQPEDRGGGLRSLRPVHHPLPGGSAPGDGMTWTRCWKLWQIRIRSQWCRWRPQCGRPGARSLA